MPTHPQPGRSSAGDARSLDKRLAAVEAVVSPDELRTRRLVVTDEVGEARIVAAVYRGQASLRVMVGGCVPGEETMVDISATDDPEFGPAVGVHLSGLPKFVGMFGAPG